MALPRLFKIPNHRIFTYQPRYYDPAKEQREEREKRIRAELGLPSDAYVAGGYKPTIHRGSMRGIFHENKKVRSKSNLRVVIILAFLLGLVYFLVYA